MDIDECPLTDEFAAEKDEKYSLRRRGRRQPSRSKPEPEPKETSSRGKKDKKKPKAQPLSKYRRKTANARERTRMREINSAFENLRNCVPTSISNGTPTSTNEKLTKITTLRLAMKYISSLNEVLTSPYSDSNCILDELMNRNSDTDTVILNNNNDNNNSIAHNFNNNNTNTIEINNNNKTNGKSRKRASKKSTTATATVTSSTTSKRANKTTKTTKASRGRNAKKAELEPPCLIPPLESPVDLGLMLESDGESLHLSEPCLSPLGQNIKPFNNSLSTNGVLELGMFLESDNDSLEFSEPYLSPLGAFDTLSPFGDLLHSGFSEQSALDIYLT